jgi:hypothetical protein
MHLVQILLPLYDNEQQPQPPASFRDVQKELTEQFGGLTAYTRAPAQGLWKQNGNHTTRDDIVIFEVMAEELDAAWWGEYRQQLESRFRQEQIVIRAQQTQLL